MSNLAEKMSGYYRNRTWTLLYRMKENGVSMITFMEKIKREEITLIICLDEEGHKFGGIAFEEWVPRKNFFGTGESFVYTFGTSDNLNVYYGTGKN